MKKVIPVLLLTFSLLLATLCLSIGAAPEGTPVSSAAEFEAMVSGGQYYLTKDIDLGGKIYDGYIFQEFSGTIDGNGFSVFNYTLRGDNILETRVGTIRQSNVNADMIIKNIAFGKEGNPVKVDVPVGKFIGVVVGEAKNDAAKNLIFENVTVYSDIVVTDISAAERMVGGFVGYAANTTMTDCKSYGTVTLGDPSFADPFQLAVGGFIGRSYSSRVINITNCENYADVSVYCSTVGARAGGFSGNSVSNITLINCTNNGNITAYDAADTKSTSFAGGIVAMANNSNHVEINDCVNNGIITGTNAVGGIIGSAGGATSGSASIVRCINYGTYSLDAANAGPFYGVISPAGTLREFVDCLDYSAGGEPVPGTTPEATTPVETTPDETTPAETTPDETTPTETTPDATTPDETTPDETTPDTTPPPAESGCGSAVGGGAIMLISLSASAVCFIRKKK